jgi:hypothetical protein
MLEKIKESETKAVISMECIRKNIREFDAEYYKNRNLIEWYFGWLICQLDPSKTKNPL